MNFDFKLAKLQFIVALDEPCALYMNTNYSTILLKSEMFKTTS